MILLICDKLSIVPTVSKEAETKRTSHTETHATSTCDTKVEKADFLAAPTSVII